MTETLRRAAHTILKEGLAQCTDRQQMMFKRMYCHANLDLSIDSAVDQMEDGKIDRAIEQVEATIRKNVKRTSTEV